MAQFTTITSHVVPMSLNNVDTDQIIPARYLKATDKHGMGANLFADWRYSSDGTPRPDFALNRPEAQGAQILLAGDNFGCGSSREHALWALTGWGFRAVIARSFADIFRNNALKNGLLPVAADENTYQTLLALVQEDPMALLTIDLESQVVKWPVGKRASFEIDPFSRTCLLQGVDELGYLMGFMDRIQAFEAKFVGGEGSRV